MGDDSVLKRAAVAVGGFSLVTVGLLLLVLPGPGWALIFAGLALLATEFPSVARLLAPLRRLAESGSEWFHRMSRGHRIAVVVLFLALLLAFSMFWAWLLF